MASLNFGLERQLVITTRMLDEAILRGHRYHDRIDTLREQLADANTALDAANAARDAAEVSRDIAEATTEDAIVAVQEAEAATTTALAVHGGEGQGPELQQPAPQAPQRRVRNHPRMMVTRTKKSLRAQKRCIKRRPIVAPFLALPAPASAQQGPADSSQEETKPEERIPASSDEESIDEPFDP